MGRYVPTEAEREAIDLLTLAGYKVLRQRGHAALLERVRVAEAEASWANQYAANTRQWAYGQCDEVRRLRDRLTFVYGVARARGATVEELRDERRGDHA